MIHIALTLCYKLESFLTSPLIIHITKGAQTVGRKTSWA